MTPTRKRTPPRDNVTFSQKVMLRQTALRLLGDEPPVILETHGGRGAIWETLYHPFETGVVFERDPDRALLLARQRPTWAVYEADVEIALAAGAGRHLTFNYMDVDPYGSCWETLQAFFGSSRSFAPRMVVVVNDGLGYKLRGGAAWHVGVMEQAVLRYGNHEAWRMYPTVIVRELMHATVATAGYTVKRFESYPTGIGLKMVHMLAVLEQPVTVA